MVSTINCRVERDSLGQRFREFGALMGVAEIISRTLKRTGRNIDQFTRSAQRETRWRLTRRRLRAAPSLLRCTHITLLAVVPRGAFRRNITIRDILGDFHPIAGQWIAVT